MQKFLLDKTKSGLVKDAIRFMERQPEAYAVAVLLYDKCNPFKNNNVLPFINWCFQKNKIKNEYENSLDMYIQNTKNMLSAKLIQKNATLKESELKKYFEIIYKSIIFSFL